MFIKCASTKKDELLMNSIFFTKIDDIANEPKSAFGAFWQRPRTANRVGRRSAVWERTWLWSLSNFAPREGARGSAGREAKGEAADVSREPGARDGRWGVGAGRMAKAVARSGRRGREARGRVWGAGAGGGRRGQVPWGQRSSRGGWGSGGRGGERGEGAGQSRAAGGRGRGPGEAGRGGASGSARRCILVLAFQAR